MALKFRRGTTAQQSGSLAFGEPYVNTTLGTLLVGGPDGDIVLSATGTGSTGNFGAISGSGLDITGDARIGGNLTLGGTITVGDTNTDNIVINADLSSSIIPDVTNTFDLGSTSKVYRNVYATSISGAIAATNGVVSGSSQVIDILSSLNSYTSSNDTTNTTQNSRLSDLEASASAALITNVSQSNSISGITTVVNKHASEIASIHSFTASIDTTIKSKLDTEGVISGSGQIVLSDTNGFTSFSSSVDSRITTEKNRVDAILSASSADKDSFAEIVELINSVDTSNDASFAAFYTASNGRLNNLESTSASLLIETSNLESFSASALTRLAALEVETSNLESFTSSINTTIKTQLNANTVVSGSSQINYSSISNIPSGIVSGAAQVTPLLPTGTVSGSSQVVGILSSLNSYTASNDTTNTTQNSRLDQLSTASGSAIGRLNNLESTSASLLIETSNLEAFSASALTRLGNLESKSASVDTSISNLNSFSSSQLSKDATLATYTASVEGRFATLGSLSGSFARTNVDNSFSGLQTFNNINVNGTASFAYIQSTTGSSTSIGEAFIILNENTPSANYAGIKVVDSGSSFTTASFVYDGLNNQWVFEKANNGTPDSSIAIFGPISQGGLGTEVGLTQNKLPKAVSTHGHHIGDSQISDDGSTVSIPGALTVTGNITGPIRATNGVVSGSSQITYSSISGIPAGIVSGSSQISHDSTTGYSANRHVDHTAVSITAGSGLSGGGDISATRTISIATGGVTNDMLAGSIANSKLTNSAITIAGTSVSLGGSITLATITGASGIVSGSSQIDHNSTTNYSANRHIDHTAVSISAGSGLTGGGDISANRTISIASGGVTNDMLAGSIANSKLSNSSVTVTAGTGLSGGGAVSLGGSVTLSNAGVTSNVAGTGVSVSAATGAVTISIGQAVATTSNVRFGSIGVGMAASGTSGRIDAANDIVAFSSSDIRFKENIKPIENPIQKIRQISGNTYDWKAENKEFHGYEGNDVGVIAQEIEAVLPQLVQTRESGFKAVKYDKLVALLIEGIKEQQLQIEKLQIEVSNLKIQKGL